MVVTVGNVYKFKYIQAFNALDGIYKVLRIMTFDEAVSDQIDLQELYTKYGKTVEDYNNDLPELRVNIILKLESVNTFDVVYTPIKIHELEADPNVRKYLHLVLGIDLGLYATLDQTLYIKNIVKDLLSGGLGVTTDPIVTEITSKQAWLTTAEYDTISNNRQSIKDKVVNLHTENNRLRKELASANAKVASYEEILQQLHTA